MCTLNDTSHNAEIPESFQILGVLADQVMINYWAYSRQLKTRLCADKCSTIGTFDRKTLKIHNYVSPPFLTQLT
ncbi:hypothetical protein [Chamaesiphon sp. OTE_20_metabat_361]|uniref:hypothetical protein n=1 Tax=Chamaesiphon sp. OTE_20_metabat_361 TaxID=2964689 RepID=UPI00286C95D6|nr:hypothetical protein [Chamaesiphon sp. OTE_20_metabat_361]